MKRYQHQYLLDHDGIASFDKSCIDRGNSLDQGRSQHVQLLPGDYQARAMDNIRSAQLVQDTLVGIHPYPIHVSALALF